MLNIGAKKRCPVPETDGQHLKKWATLKRVNLAPIFAMYQTVTSMGRFFGTFSSKNTK